MARGTLRCGLFLIFGLSSILASAVLDLVSRVGTQVGTPTPTLHERRHTCGDPGRDARDIRCYIPFTDVCAAARSTESERPVPWFVPSLSSDSEPYRLSSEAERASELVVFRFYASLSTADNQFIYRLGRGRTEKNMMSEYRVPVVTALTACTWSELWTVASPSERSIRWMWPSKTPSRWPPP